jgi:SNF2 family DNA or RNA helicase
MAQQHKQPPPQGKPVLIVVPPNLLIPWAKEISRIARLNRFNIFIYKCVVHKESIPKHKTHLTRPMERKTLLSKTSPYGAGAIILTTYQSFGQRHGAEAIKEWQRKNHLPIVNKPKTMPSECPYNLSGCFGTVFLDEGHMARNKQSGVHRTLTWLDADFYLLATATPFYNTITDFRGYIPFLFSSKPIWDDLEDEHDLDVSTTDPFEVPDDHHAAIGRFTSEAVGRYILRRGISAETAGANMRKILQELMIHRTYYSRIPFESGPTIGSEIPLAHRKKIEVEWESIEKTIYRKLSQQYRKSLLSKSEKTSKYMWNMKAYRSLVLLTAWLGMPFVEQSLDSAGFPLALKALERGCVVTNWIWKALSTGSMVTKDKVYEFYNGIPDSQSPSSIGATTKLELLLRGSPKLRAMIPIVTNQVIVHREKAIVWCAFPATQVFVCAALREAQIDARIHVGTAISIELLKKDYWHVSEVRKEMQAERGSELIETFNTKPDKCMVPVCLYGVSASGLNLQSMCHNVHLFDAASSQAAVDHAIGRTCRLGQFRSVLVYEYRLKKSFHDEMILRNRKKVQPGMVTDLSTTIFKDLLEGDDDSDGNFAALDHKSLAKWVVRDGQLVELDNDEEPQEGDSQDTEEILDLLAEMVQDRMC